MLRLKYIVNSVFSSRTYALSTEGSSDVWLVDCGDWEKIGFDDDVDHDANVDEDDDWRVVGVLLTHAHSDHIYGLNKLVERFPDVRIVTNAYGVKALHDPRLNISAYHSEYEDFILNSSTKVEVVQEGSTLDVLGQEVCVYETSGHDPSCLCFEVDGRLFTGDAHIPGVKLFTGFPKSDKKMAAASEQRILALVKERRLEVCAGHEV